MRSNVIEFPPANRRPLPVFELVRVKEQNGSVYFAIHAFVENAVPQGRRQDRALVWWEGVSYAAAKRVCENIAREFAPTPVRIDDCAVQAMIG